MGAVKRCRVALSTANPQEAFEGRFFDMTWSGQLATSKATQRISAACILFSLCKIRCIAQRIDSGGVQMVTWLSRGKTSNLLRSTASDKLLILHFDARKRRSKQIRRIRTCQTVECCTRVKNEKTRRLWEMGNVSIVQIVHNA